LNIICFSKFGSTDSLTEMLGPPGGDQTLEVFVSALETPEQFWVQVSSMILIGRDNDHQQTLNLSLFSGHQRKWYQTG